MFAIINSPKNTIRLLALALVLPAMLVHAAPDLSVTKTVDNPQPGAGQPVEFTIELTNAGPDPALSAQVLDVLPTGTAIPDGAAAFPSVGVYDPVTGVWTVGGMVPAQSRDAGGARHHYRGTATRLHCEHGHRLGSCGYQS